eukprot:GGOE01020405.1.p1 GENE.GGOE01020405.1~~GGOE01020405.1.p1  ORF type:complete len:352 (+),score=42.05 GGOE01020405.1:37-1092(+)
MLSAPCGVQRDRCATAVGSAPGQRPAPLPDSSLGDDGGRCGATAGDEGRGRVEGKEKEDDEEDGIPLDHWDIVSREWCSAVMGGSLRLHPVPRVQRLAWPCSAASTVVVSVCPASNAPHPTPTDDSRPSPVLRSVGEAHAISPQPRRLAFRPCGFPSGAFGDPEGVLQTRNVAPVKGASQRLLAVPPRPDPPPLPPGPQRTPQEIGMLLRRLCPRQRLRPAPIECPGAPPEKVLSRKAREQLLQRLYRWKAITEDRRRRQQQALPPQCRQSQPTISGEAQADLVDRLYVKDPAKRRTHKEAARAQVLRDLVQLHRSAAPNPAHRALYERLFLQAEPSPPLPDNAAEGPQLP